MWLCNFFRRNLISWLAKKQLIVARSSTEAEFCIFTDVMQEIMWVRNLLEEIGFGSNIKIRIWTDNLGAKHLAYNS